MNTKKNKFIGEYESEYRQEHIELELLEPSIELDDIIYVLCTFKSAKLALTFANNNKLKHFFATIKGISRDFIYMEMKI